MGGVDPIFLDGMKRKNEHKFQYYCKRGKCVKMSKSEDGFMYMLFYALSRSHALASV